MPSNRRLKVYGLLIAIIIITTLFYTSQSRASRSPDFYSKTINALDRKPGTAGAKDSVVGTGEHGLGGKEENKAMQQRLKEAADSAREKANAKAPKPDPPSAVVGKGNAAEGAGDRGVGGRRKQHGSGESQKAVESEEEHDAEVELNSILKKAPSKF